MLTIKVPGAEFYDESRGEFFTHDDFVLDLEHSLVSLSKWESKWEKAFLGPNEKTTEEVLSYIEEMILNPEYPPDIVSRLSKENLDQVNTYLNAKMTATWFHEMPGAPKSREVITSELVYYWMTVCSIPFECDKWHINRLFVLIRIWNVKNAKPKKQSRNAAAEQRRALNEQRKAQMGTSG